MVGLNTALNKVFIKTKFIIYKPYLLILLNFSNNKVEIGAVSGTIRGVIGLPMDTTKRIIRMPERKEEV
jgi:hypothetical protein